MSGCLGIENMETVLFSDMSCSISFLSLFVSEIIILFNSSRHFLFCLPNINL